jgi:hypothetical protein
MPPGGRLSVVGKRLGPSVKARSRNAVHLVHQPLQLGTDGRHVPPILAPRTWRLLVRKPDDNDDLGLKTR